MSSGHDEYWSGQQRKNVEAARAAGVNLAFFSGNEMFWKTRWENSTDGSNTSYRTLVTYKETHFNAPTDPLDPTVWTGAWADPRFSPPADGGNPANALTGPGVLGQRAGRPRSRCPASTPSSDSGATPPRRTSARRRRCRWPRTRSATSGTSTPTTASGRPVCSTSRRRPPAGCSCSPTTAARPRTAAPPRTTSPCTGRPAARWCSARARSSGPGVSTTRTRRTSPRTRTCSRRRSTCSPTWACSRRR